jgi:hypothetical protein
VSGQTNGSRPSDDRLERRAARAEDEIVETIDEIQRRFGGAKETVEEVAEHTPDLSLVAALSASLAAAGFVWAIHRATSPVAIRARVLRAIIRLFPVERASLTRRVLRVALGASIVSAAGWGTRVAVLKAMTSARPHAPH